MEQFDVLVVGSGGAGMRAALEVGRRKGLKVALITKIFPTRSATAMAQGGVNACLNNVAAEDTVETHTFDTVKVLTILATKMQSNSSALVVQKAYLKWTTWVLLSLVLKKIKLRNVTSVVNPIHVLVTLRIKLVTLFCTQLTNNA